MGKITINTFGDAFEEAKVIADQTLEKKLKPKTTMERLKLIGDLKNEEKLIQEVESSKNDKKDFEDSKKKQTVFNEKSTKTKERKNQQTIYVRDNVLNAWEELNKLEKKYGENTTSAGELIRLGIKARIKEIKWANEE